MVCLRGLGRSGGSSTAFALLGVTLCTHGKIGWRKYVAPSIRLPLLVIFLRLSENLIAEKMSVELLKQRQKARAVHFRPGFLTNKF